MVFLPETLGETGAAGTPIAVALAADSGGTLVVARGFEGGTVVLWVS